MLAPLTLDTLSTIWPTALSVAFVGLLETLLTAKLVDEMTSTSSNKGRESWALGIANLLAGFWGGIAGCAMIGQTVVNVKLGRARTRISTFVAGVFLLALITVLSDVMERIPMVALAAVMMVVAVSTVNFHSVRPSTLKRMPFSETAVMIVTVAATVTTGNLAIGVGLGVLLAMLLFARRVAHVVTVTRTLEPEGDTDSNAEATYACYTIHGPLFFGSSNDLVEQFSYTEDPARVVIDFSEAQIWDASTVAVLDSIREKYTEQHIEVAFVGLDARSTDFHARLSGTLNP